MTVGNLRAYSARSWAAMGLFLLSGLLPTVRGLGVRVIATLRSPPPPARRLTTLLVSAGAAAWFLATAWFYGRAPWPKIHDEFSYWLSAQQLARGHVWMPGHPLANAFDSFYVFTQPVYGSMYFPGGGLAYVPAVWISLPPGLWAGIIGGLVVGMTYRVVGGLLHDYAAGLLAAALLAMNPTFRMVAAMVMSHPVLILATLGTTWAWLRWREHSGPPSAAFMTLMGLFGGWAFVTRPLDALCLLTPVAVATLVRIAREAGATGGWRRAGVAILCAAAGLSPFAMLQVRQNTGLSGSWLGFPHDLYVRQDMPGGQFGFHEVDPNARPASLVPQKQSFQDDWTNRFVASHMPETFVQEWLTERLPVTLVSTLSHPMMLIPLGVGLAGVTLDVRRSGAYGPLAVVLVGVPVFLIAYVFYCFYMPWYPLVLAPASLTAVAAAPNAVALVSPTRQAEVVRLLVILAIFGIGASRLPGVDPSNRMLWFDPPELAAIDAMTERVGVAGPAIVLFQYHPMISPHVEPVYNSDVAWPDNARVIRAHDLGVRNADVIRYYGATQPDRWLYLYVRVEQRLLSIGRVGDLAAALDGVPGNAN